MKLIRNIIALVLIIIAMVLAIPIILTAGLVSLVITDEMYEYIKTESEKLNEEREEGA